MNMNPFASLLLGLVSALGSGGAPQAQNALEAPNPQAQNALGAPNPQALQSLLQMSVMSLNPIAFLLSQTPRRNTSIPDGMFGMMPWAPPNPFIPVPFIPGGFVGYSPVEKQSGDTLPREGLVRNPPIEMSPRERR